MRNRFRHWWPYVVVLAGLARVSAEERRQLEMPYADHLEVVVSEGRETWYVWGSVVFQTEAGWIYCDSAVWHRGETIRAQGSVIIDDEEYHLAADSVDYSLVTEEANIVYAPIGPYKAGLIRRFDAASAEDRAAAKSVGHGYDRSNVCLRVTQGGRETAYLMPLRLSEDDDPLKAFHVAAINLPARDGEVTEAQLVYAPGVVEGGVGADARTLFTWSK